MFLIDKRDGTLLMFAQAPGKAKKLLLPTNFAFQPSIERRTDDKLLWPNKKKRDHQSYSQII